MSSLTFSIFIVYKKEIHEIRSQRYQNLWYLPVKFEPCDVVISPHSVVSSQRLLLSHSLFSEFKDTFIDKKGPLLSSRVDNGKDID